MRSSDGWPFKRVRANSIVANNNARDEHAPNTVAQNNERPGPIVGRSVTIYPVSASHTPNYRQESATRVG